MGNTAVVTGTANDSATKVGNPSEGSYPKCTKLSTASSTHQFPPDSGDCVAEEHPSPTVVSGVANPTLGALPQPKARGALDTKPIVTPDERELWSGSTNLAVPVDRVPTHGAAPSTLLTGVPRVLPNDFRLDVDQQVHIILDHDDTGAFMRDTAVIVEHRQTGEELRIPTNVYAKMKNRINFDRDLSQGKREKLDPSRNPQGKELASLDLSTMSMEDIERSIDFGWFYHHLKSNPDETDFNEARDGAFREFRDARDPYIFVKHLSNAFQRGDTGPMFSLAQLALSHPGTAQFFKTLTARGHALESGQDGWEYAVQLGLVDYAPPRKNMQMASNPETHAEVGLSGSAARPSAVKVAAIRQLLDQLETQEVGPRAQPIVFGDRRDVRKGHMVVFADDDPDTIQMMRDKIGADYHWKNTKFMLIESNEDPHEYVYTDRGEREVMVGEQFEISNIIARVLPPNIKAPLPPDVEWGRNAVDN